LANSNPEDKLNQDLKSLQAELPELPSERIDRELAEVSHEIEFLESQVIADIGSYSPEELKRANEKISHFKQRAEIFRIQLNLRSSK